MNERANKILKFWFVESNHEDWFRKNDNFDKFNLTKWASIEKENPDMFIGMYQLWCQKN